MVEINVTYEGAWTNEMKDAFEYACKIWRNFKFPISIIIL